MNFINRSKNVLVNNFKLMSIFHAETETRLIPIGSCFPPFWCDMELMSSLNQECEKDETFKVPKKAKHIFSYLNFDYQFTLKLPNLPLDPKLICFCTFDSEYPQNMFLIINFLFFYDSKEGISFDFSHFLLFKNPPFILQSKNHSP